MKLGDLYEKIQDEKPQILYICGKTCVGKSTFAGKLKDVLGYENIELDKVLFDSVITPQALADEKTVFIEVYKNNDKRELIDPFIAAARQLIATKATRRQPIVIEGAVANTDTLARIFENGPAFLFIYFHPEDIEVYQRNLTSRFMLSTKHSSSGLPKRFWEFVDDNDFDAFCKDQILSPGLIRSIGQYAHLSQIESKKRLSAFREKFSNITVINI